MQLIFKWIGVICIVSACLHFVETALVPALTVMRWSCFVCGVALLVMILFVKPQVWNKWRDKLNKESAGHGSRVLSASDAQDSLESMFDMADERMERL